MSLEYFSPKTKRILSIATSKTISPQFEIKNPIDSEVNLNGISLLPTNTFRSKGRLIVEVNGIPMDTIFGEDMIDVAKVQLIEGDQKKLGKGKKIKFFLWNFTNDGGDVAVTVGVTFGSR